MRWIDATASKPPDYETVLIRTASAAYMVGYYEPSAGRGNGSWIIPLRGRVALRLYGHEVALWSYIEPPVTEAVQP